MRQITGRLALLSALLAVAFVMATCSQLEGDRGRRGGDGPAGEQGEQGPAGTVDPTDPTIEQLSAESCATCHGPGREADIAVMHGIELAAHSSEGIVTEVTLDITAVDTSTATAWTVTFDATDQNGDPVVGLTKGDVGVTLAALIPASGSVPSYWFSYIRSVKTKATGVGTMPEGTKRVQPGYQGSYGAGSMVENSSGNYTFTFSGINPTTDAEYPGGYSSADTNRVGVYLANHDLPAATDTFDFVPASDTEVTPAPRHLVETASCDNCHNQISAHGGARIGVELCVTCHNATVSDTTTADGSLLVADPESGEVLDMRVLTHKIHMGRNLPSVDAGGEYTIWGYQDREHNYSEVGFPQEPTNCVTCHSDGATDYTDYADAPSVEACGACHDDKAWAGGSVTGHSGGDAVTTADGCGTSGNCHFSDGPQYASAEATTGKHYDPVLGQLDDFVFGVDDVTIDGTSVTVDFHVQNASATKYDILNSAKFDSSDARLRVLLGWSTTDYTNAGSGNILGQPITINALDTATNIGGKIFRVTGTIPSDVEGTAVVGLTGRAIVDTDDIPITNVVSYSRVTDDFVERRRDIVDLPGKCNNCHGFLDFHGGQRSGTAETCVICHNPNATDLEVRPDDHTAGDGTPDGKKEESIDFKRMIHGIHAASKREDPLTVYGYQGSVHTYSEEEVTYPGILNRCDTCHDEDTYELPLASTVLATTVDSDPSAATKADASEENLLSSDDDHNITPTSAVCSACHDTLLAKAHMYQNGGRFSVTQPQIDAIDPDNY